MQIKSLTKTTIMAILILSAFVSAAKEYQVTDLGKDFTPISLNDKGEVVLRQVTGQSGGYPTFTLWTWSNNSYSQLYSAEEQMLYKAKIKNNGDSLISVVDLNGYKEHSYYGKQGQIQELPSGLGWDINNSGQMTLSVYDASTGTQSNYLREPSGEWIDCGNQAGSRVWGLAINDAGQITGISNIDNGVFHGFVWDGTTGWRSLNPLNGDISSLGRDINNKGQVVGYSAPVDLNQHSIFECDSTLTLWDPTNGIIDMNCKLSPYDMVLSINDLTEMIGELKLDTDTDFRSYYWETSAGFIAAEDLLTEDSLWQIKSLTDINNHGQILGLAQIGNEYHTVLLTPAPEPATAIIFLAGAYLLQKRKIQQNG